MTRALARNTDPLTSHAAADAITPHLGKRELAIIRVLEKYPYGRTCSEIAGEIGVGRDQVSPRMKPLQARGLVWPMNPRKGERERLWRML